LSPRALGNCAPSSPRAGASARPLNFTVRSRVKSLPTLFCLLAFSSQSTAGSLSDAQTHVLGELRECHSAVPASTDVPFNSPCGFKTDVSTLRGVSLQDLVRALGPPEVCYVADGDWRSPDKHGRCTKCGAPGWSFFQLPFDWMGGGAYFLCRLDTDGRCSSPFWRGTK
jgi:hypothetical protein